MTYDVSLHRAEKRFGDKVIFSDLNVHFEEGKIHGIIGRNGSGKTVLFKCICGFIEDYAGEIRIGGKERKEIKIERLSIGAIIETPGFVSGYSGYTNLKFFADIRNLIGKAQIIESIRRVGLDPQSRKPVDKYSTGMKQRLGIAQAIMEDPKLLILDEPMNGLDNAGVRDMRILFLELKEKGKTILLASHNKDDVEELCDTVHEMDAGELTRVR